MLHCPWDSPGKNTGVGCHALLQEIFQTQESNSGLLHCRQILYRLSNLESRKSQVNATQFPNSRGSGPQKTVSIGPRFS